MCFKEADIILPKEYQNPGFMEKWAVIACDQYTSDMNYWNRVKDCSENNMSALHLVFPEIYLESESAEEQCSRMKNIAENMRDYADSFVCFENSMFLIERTLRNGAKRFGIIGAVDLEEYGYTADSRLQIRSTEETVISRIPPRVKIRENASFELPHVMLLYDDEQNHLIGSLKNKNLNEVYNFRLMQDSGAVKAFRLDAESIDFVKNTLKLHQNKREYLFAVGDGNHSLASAKECYENIKKHTPDYLHHPARYALAEIVNIYDESLEFEPIYRILFDVDPSHVIQKLSETYEAYGTAISDVEDAEKVHNAHKNAHRFEMYYGEECYITTVKSEYELPMKTLQVFLDGYLESHGGKIDYIHGENDVKELAKQPNAICFLCGTVQKSDLFKIVEKDGVLPRKTFSMGEACDKRFYVECRKIK
jgi:uncharacterized protein (DUF1015 family)